MRTPFAIAFLTLVTAGLAAQDFEDPTTPPPEDTLYLDEFYDENGNYTDNSGDGTIWTTMHQWAALRIQVCAPETDLPEPVLGEITRRPGNEGVLISVDGPPGVEIETARVNRDWRTDADGVLVVRVRVPEEEGRYTFTFKTDNIEVRTLTLSISVKSPNWILWLVLGMLGGLSLFLYGMSVGSEGLQEAAGTGFREALHTLTKNPVRGVGMGTAATFMTQSSSATTVMLVGFVRAGLMDLRQTMGPIFGAAIGTTLTVQLISFKIQAYALPLMALGFLMKFFFQRSPKAVAYGRIIFGFGMIFFGMAVMGEVISPLKASPEFSEMLTRLTGRPMWCMIVVTIFTALIQSSGATIGIALTLANQDLLSLHEALPIIFGANIGTCVTAILASMGGTLDGKRVALAHLIFKVGTVAVFFFWPMFGLLAWMSELVSHLMASWFPGVPILNDSVARQMANADTIMCVLSTVLAVAFFRTPLERAVLWLVPEDKTEHKEKRAKYLDLAMLDSPGLALGAARREISRMGRLVEEMVKGSQHALETRDPEVLQWLRRRDDKVDRAFTRINEFLTQLTGTNPGKEHADRAIGLLYVINDLESIGDLVVKNLVPTVNKMIDQDLNFSEEGMAEVCDLHGRVSDSLSKTMLALTTPGEEELFEEVIQRQEDLQIHGRRLHLRHLKRLQEGLQETIATSSIHLDIVNYLLRMHYHIYSIAWTSCHGVSAHEDTA